MALLSQTIAARERVGEEGLDGGVDGFDGTIDVWTAPPMISRSNSLPRAGVISAASWLLSDARFRRLSASSEPTTARILWAEAEVDFFLGGGHRPESNINIQHQRPTSNVEGRTSATSARASLRGLLAEVDGMSEAERPWSGSRVLKLAFRSLQALINWAAKPLLRAVSRRLPWTWLRGR